MADDLSMSESVSVAEPALAASEPPATLKPPAAPLYGVRFGVAYALLAVVLGAALGVGIVIGTGDAATPSTWASWQPTADGITPRMRQIADHVSAAYRLPSGRQLVGVAPAQLAVVAQGDAVRVAAIALRTGGAEQDAIRFDDARGAWMFSMCGLGDRCSINEGKATAERLRLLRRQALELALYSFRYEDGVNAVVAFLPPAPGKDTTPFALYFRRADLQQQIARPLRQTLLPATTLTPDALPADEADLVDALTESRLYSFTFQQAQNGAAILILDPAA
jgi:hypothetical protein